MLSRLVRHVGDKALMKVLDSLSFDLTRAGLACRRTLDTNWSESFCDRRFSNLFADDAVKPDEAFTVLGQKEDIDGGLLRSKTLAKLIVAWLWKDYVCYRDAESAVAFFLR